MEKKRYPYILLMKAGPYCGYSLPEIIDIKQKEQRACGKFFWGYGGVFCRPHGVHAFASYAKKRGCSVTVLFSQTDSSYETSGFGRFTRYSLDESRWQDLPAQVLLVGNTRKPHFAITARRLRKADFDLNLCDYVSFSGMGMFPDLHKRLDTYFRYRVDKACAVRAPHTKDTERPLHVGYLAELVEPYCVYIR